MPGSPQNPVRIMLHTACVVALVLLFAAHSPGVSVCGSCNGDGAVSMSDVALCEAIANGQAPLVNCPACDCDQTGQVTQQDLQIIENNATPGCCLNSLVCDCMTPTETPGELASDTPTPPPTPTVSAAAVCVGDCGGHHVVAVNDVIILVNIVLGIAQPSACADGIPSGAAVNVALIIRAVGSVLNGCAATPTAAPSPALFVYWDQNEEEDTLTASGQLAQLVPPWDPNGQMCIFPPGFGPSGGGGFVTGYNPTLPGQHNLGSRNPLMDPPVGLVVWNRDGSFSGQTISVPGPYAIPGHTGGGDIPPDLANTFCTNGVTTGRCTSDADCPGGMCSGTFNDNGSFTGCAFDSKGHLFGADIGQAQGSVSSPDQGRIIEWFPPDYKDFCILLGPTQGGDAAGMHHVNGTGGLRNPGMMAVDPQDNLYIPESGNSRVLKVDHAAIPNTVQDCTGQNGLLNPPVPFTEFIGKGKVLAPAGIARDPSCSTDTTNCWAVTNVTSHAFGGNAVVWFDDQGNITNAKGPIPRGSFSPFGVAVGPNGDVFFVDIGLTCTATGCDTIDGGGGVYQVSFTNGQPGTPTRIIAGLNFPVSVTVCDANSRVCPEPASAATPIVQPTPGATPTAGQG